MSYRTQLADLMIEARGSKNQAEFQAELEKLAELQKGGLGAKYVSLVETGARKKLSPEFLRAMELKTGKPQAELQAMNRRASLRDEPRPVRTVLIASGHTTYAAGLIGACLKGTKLVELATCCKRGEQPSKENARWIRMEKGGGPPLKDEKFLAEVADERQTFYFSANEALDALDAGWVDLAAIPGSLVEGRRSYQRLLRLVASDAACMLIANERLAKALLPEATKKQDGRSESRVETGWKKDNEIPVFDLTTHDLGRRITEMVHRNEANDASKHERMYRIGAETRTIAEVVLDEAVSFAVAWTKRDAVSMANILVPVASREAAGFSAKTLDGMRGENAPEGDGELDGLLLWEPNASWVVEKLKARGAKTHALISLARSADEATHRPRRFEFDLVTTPAKATDPELLRAVRDLHDRIWEVSEELAVFKPSLYHGLVNPLSTYFRLGEPTNPVTIRRATRVLGSVAYDVGVKPEALSLFDSAAD